MIKRPLPVRPLESYFKLARWSVLLIIVVGTIRLLLTTAGLPNSQVKFASMTVVIAVSAVHFAIWSARHGWSYRDLFILSYFLTLPYMVVEIVGLSVVGLTGQENIFHAREYSFGTPLWMHLAGHAVGGVTWEPWTLWLICCLLYWATARIYGKLDKVSG